MTLASLIRLFSLAAIWGSSFIFMRIGAPALGPTLLIEFRVGLAAVFLALVGRALHKDLGWKRHWRYFMTLGLLNSALPFLLFAYAAQTLSASLLSVLNATAPIWGALIGAVWTRSRLSAKTVLGLALGVTGVGLLVGFDAVTLRPGAGIAIAAACGASFCYGMATQYTKISSQKAATIDPFANAHGCMWAATAMIAPALPFSPLPQAVGMDVIVSVAMLGVVCSGVAYLLYFRLIADLGATSALTVTFLIPMFGIIWGHLFLGEAIGWHTVAGSFIVILGTIFVTGFSFSGLLRRPSQALVAKK